MRADIDFGQRLFEYQLVLQRRLHHHIFRFGNVIFIADGKREINSSRFLCRIVDDTVLGDIGIRNDDPLVIIGCDDRRHKADLRHKAALAVHFHIVARAERMVQQNLNAGGKLRHAVLQAETDGNACGGKRGNQGIELDEHGKRTKHEGQADHEAHDLSDEVIDRKIDLAALHGFTHDVGNKACQHKAADDNQHGKYDLRQRFQKAVPKVPFLPDRGKVFDCFIGLDELAVFVQKGIGRGRRFQPELQQA